MIELGRGMIFPDRYDRDQPDGPDPCDACETTGCVLDEDGDATLEPCPVCGGTGQVG